MNTQDEQTIKDLKRLKLWIKKYRKGEVKAEDFSTFAIFPKEKINEYRN